MKKIILTCSMLVACFVAFAQQAPQLPLLVHPLAPPLPAAAHLPDPAHPNQIVPISFPIDYNYAESMIWNNPPTSNWGDFIWKAHGRYTVADANANNTALSNYFIAVFDSIYDSFGLQGYDVSTFSGMKVDSLVFRIGHENHSGTPDTLIASVLSVDQSGYPTNTVLKSDTLISSASSSYEFTTFNNFNFTEDIKFHPNVTVPGRKFAVKLIYFGAKQDSFAFLCGAGYKSGTCPALPGLTMFAQTTNFSRIDAVPTPFYANSLIYWTQFSTLYPSAGGGLVFYDCDNSGTVTPNDGMTFFQDVHMQAYVTIDQSLGINVSSDATICDGRTTTIYGNPGGGIPPLTYQWSPATGLACATCPTTTASPTQTTTYTFTATDNSTTLSHTMTVNVVPNNVTADFTVEYPSNLKLKITNASQNATNYIWNFGTNASPATASTGGPFNITYSIQGLKHIKCRATQSGALCTDSITKDIYVGYAGMPEIYGVEDFSLSQNSPNPFSEYTDIEYELLFPSEMEIDMTDITGRTIRQWKFEHQSEGKHSLHVSASDLSSGVYFYTLKANHFSVTKKMAVTKE